MPPKQAKKKQVSPADNEVSRRNSIIDATMTLAAQQGWSLTTARDICAEAGVTLPEFYECFDGRDDVLIAYGRRLDNRVLDAFSDFNPETPVRDLIFDILMERFDLANAEKAAIRSIMESCRLDPKFALFSLPPLMASMTRMFEAAGINAYGWKGAARVAGLSLATAWVTRTWLQDDSPDLTKTMAALDKALSRIENLANRFNL